MTTSSTNPHDKARAAARKAFLRKLKIAADFGPFDDALSAALTAAEPYIRAMVVEECANIDSETACPECGWAGTLLTRIRALASRTASEGN